MRQSRMRCARVWSRRFGSAVGTIAVVAVAVLAGGAGSAAAATSSSYQELFRPQFHYTPAKNWMNDPNGLVYYKGEYHLFYQYNPFGSQWGHISWGHAVSRDLVHWHELPVAIPEQGDELVFSGSAVVDKDNTSGLGTRHNPPMVAIYTAAKPGSQAQALAYSTDRGRTFKRYSGNPVLDIGSGEFRDPKVFWYAPAHEWRMVVSKAVERKIAIYRSPNLKDWTHLSDFGPANATAGVWECPDLFPLAVDGKRRKTKWVMIVNLNPGGIAGGSGAQYFVGDFDGTTFTADNRVGDYTPPQGDLYEGFEGSNYGAWSTTGDAFGNGPAAGNVPPQGGVSGYLGNGLANSFHNEDRGTGTLTSPTFTISRPYLNFLIGGGNHPHDPATSDAPAAGGTVFADFEVPDGYGAGWTATGTFAGTTAAHGTIGDQQPVSGYEGQQLVNTFIDHDNGTGHITSPDFEVTSDYINFLIGGGSHPYPGDAGNPPTAVTLVVDGQVVRSSTGQESEALNWTNWNVSELKGKTAHIDIVDENTGGWGHINADQFTFSDQPALPRSTETAVNLLVDGNVVRTATGPNSEQLDWAAWNLADLVGRSAQIQLVDRNTGGWGHLLADNFAFADQPAQSVLQRSSWMDYGKDFYAAVTWNDVPDGRRVAIGWMNNWNYAGAIPTDPWRSAMSVPRELALQTIDGQARLVQRPVRELHSLRGGRSFTQHHRKLPQGTITLPVRGKALEIKADLRMGSAKQAGLKVRTGNGEETVIGYDAQTAELYVDRTRSGRVDFSRDFPGVQRAPLAARHGRIRLRVLVDWSSVEVFAGGGRRVITDQVFPSADSDGVELFADGGSATLDSLKVRHLRSSWATGHRNR
jgi:fructan beta-fructosidase